MVAWYLDSRSSVPASITATSTITATASATAVVENTDLPQKMMAQIIPSLDGILYFILLLSIPLMFSAAHWRRADLTKDEEEESEIEADWQWPWKTVDWMALYGLITIAHQNASMHIPFRTKYIRSIQERWNEPKRFALQNLVERGIIPLYIQDGGVSTEEIASWGWSTTFPYIKLPISRQAKKRAYFDFVVPHPQRKEALDFVRLLTRKGHEFGFSVTRIDPFTSTVRGGFGKSNPPYKGKRFPFSVGAESRLEILLPFLPDKLLVQAHEERIHQLQYYFKGLDTRHIPLLHHSLTSIIRVEAGNWGYVELDVFVYGCAQDAGMQNEWDTNRAWEAANRELERCGLPTELI